MQAKFLIPMALSVAGGVAFATGLTLVLIPSLLVILNDFRRIFVKGLSGEWPSRESVEPRAQAPRLYGAEADAMEKALNVHVKGDR